MKSLFKLLFLFIIFSACNKVKPPEHPSFKKVEVFLQNNKGVYGLGNDRIDVNTFNLTDYKTHEFHNTTLGTKSFEVMYGFTFEGENKSFKSKAELVSQDNINWRIKKLSIMEEADSSGKHYEKTMLWEDADSLADYKVFLKIDHY